MKSFSKIKNKFLKRKIEKQHRQEILGKFTHEKRNHLLELKKLVREHERHDKKIIQAAMKEDVFQEQEGGKIHKRNRRSKRSKRRNQRRKSRKFLKKTHGGKRKRTKKNRNKNVKK